MNRILRIFLIAKYFLIEESVYIPNIKRSFYAQTDLVKSNSFVISCPITFDFFKCFFFFFLIYEITCSSIVFWILFIFLYSRFLLVIHFTLRQSQLPNSSHHHRHHHPTTFPPWCPYVCSLHLCLIKNAALYCKDIYYWTSVIIIRDR